MRIITDNLKYILLLVVLFGILFSNGEGVQLFPFCETTPASKKNSLPIPDKTYKSYSYSVHGTASLTVQSKVRQVLEHSGCHNEFIGIFEPTKLQSVLIAQINHQLPIDSISGYLALTSDRAPPSI